jgi:4-amino-4-deoxy-L-arabinose transferase-like glycosyltransferase
MWLAALLCAFAVYLLYFFDLDSCGLLGPDEPRYAAIGRAMAQTGDWITPRLWGQPWFEKPALLYWMTAAGFVLGLNQELAPRLPMALAAVSFLVFFWWALRREFGSRAAWFAAAMLATSAGWLAYGRIAVTDLPMSAAYAAALLLVLRERITAREALAAGALLGIAALAKGFVPFVLFLPAVWFLRKQWRILGLTAIAACAIALPWYVACTWQNGPAFLNEFFWKHHFERFSSPSLAHVRPVWFYIPVLIAGLFPWTPLLALLGSRPADTSSASPTFLQDRRLRLLLLSVAFGFVFFSVAVNKLPGYLLPLVPLLAALAGVALDRARQARWPLAASALLLWLVPAAQRILPDALKEGLSRTTVTLPWAWLAPAIIFAALCWFLEWRGQRAWAVVLMTAVTIIGAVHLIARTYPLMDREVSARFLWKQLSPSFQRDVCIGQMNRSLRYGLNYYAQRDLPECRGLSGEIQLNPGR